MKISHASPRSAVSLRLASSGPPLTPVFHKRFPDDDSLAAIAPWLFQRCSAEIRLDKNRLHLYLAAHYIWAPTLLSLLTECVDPVFVIDGQQVLKREV